jgi:Flp pilus assembly pilin Flp
MLRSVKDTAVRLWKDEQGASMLEYAVLTALIAGGLIATITLLKDAIIARFGQVTALIGAIAN